MRTTHPALLAIGLALSTTQGHACSPPPESVKHVKPSPQLVERGAIKTFASATYVAQVTVVRRPQLTRGMSNGLLRVDAVVKGNPPRYLVAYPDLCEINFQHVGERFVVAVMGKDLFPVVLGDRVIAALKRRKVGDWRNVR